MTLRHPLTTTFLATLCVALPAAPASAAHPLGFPARAESLDDLAFDAYFTTGGHSGYGVGDVYPLDIGIVRFDGSAWTNIEPGGSSSNQEDHLIFGFPLHSPIDGVVVSCWRELPDGTGCPPGEGCLSGGNHLNILTEDGQQVVYLAHLQHSSIPDSLCPKAQVYPSNLSQTCTEGAGWEGFQASIRTDGLPGGLPVVRKGDYLGNAGNSGSGTSAPHLHLHVKPFTYDSSGNPCQRTGEYEEIEFAESWYTERQTTSDVDASDWIAAQQTAIPFETDGTPRYLIWPDPIGPRRDDLVWGDGDELHNVPDSYGGVMGYRNDANHLQLESYGIFAGQIQPEDTVEEGTVLDLGLAAPFSSGRDIIAAVRTGSGNLKLIPYTVSAGGTIARQYGEERNEGSIQGVEATRSPLHDGVTVAIRDGASRIKVIDYVVDSATMAITRPGSSALGTAVTDLAVDTVRYGSSPEQPPLGAKFKGVVTAERRSSDGTLVVRSWGVTSGGDVSLDHTETTGVAVSEVDVTTMKVGTLREAVVVTAKDDDGDLWVEYYYVASDGELLPADDISSGAVGTISTAAVGIRDAVTALSDSGDGLKLVAWSFDEQVRRAGARKAGNTSEVLIDAVQPSGDSPYLVTLVRSLAGEIKMLVYGSNFDPTL